MNTSGSTGNTLDTSKELHEFVCDLARRAGELQLSRHESPGEIREKGPKDYVTEVDLLCEELMISAIEEHYPEDAILSEERGGEISASGRSWLLDPVDGTANFARSNPLFCACISVIENDTVTHAAVAAPRLGDLYHARLGGGAYRENGGVSTPLEVSATRELDDAFVGADISFMGAMREDGRKGTDEVFAASWQLRALGSAGIRGAWIAAGYLDASIGTRNTAWDYAPTVLLVSEAGGRATDITGEPWTPASQGLVASNGDPLHAEILGILNKR
ncbi:MAG TPA: inositol monophosphatase [Rubrobacteraceae bacterium]|nr:inositol monophosphatase [Rubrobacteraceae bacterium]